jgi:hypothetical protein
VVVDTLDLQDPVAAAVDMAGLRGQAAVVAATADVPRVVAALDDLPAVVDLPEVAMAAVVATSAIATKIAVVASTIAPTRRRVVGAWATTTASGSSER